MKQIHCISVYVLYVYLCFICRKIKGSFAPPTHSQEPIFASLVKAGSRYLSSHWECTVREVSVFSLDGGRGGGPSGLGFVITPSLSSQAPRGLLELNTIFSEHELLMENASSQTASAKPVRSSMITTLHRLELQEPLAHFSASYRESKKEHRVLIPFLSQQPRPP